jgi:hypothetical protein
MSSEKTIKQIYFEKKKEYEENYQKQCDILLSDIRKLIYEFLDLCKMYNIDSAIERGESYYTEKFYIYNNDKLLTLISLGNGRIHSIKTEVSTRVINKTNFLNNLLQEFLLNIFREIFTGCKIKYGGDLIEKNHKHYRINIIFEE